MEETKLIKSETNVHSLFMTQSLYAGRALGTNEAECTGKAENRNTDFRYKANTKS